MQDQVFCSFAHVLELVYAVVARQLAHVLALLTL